MTQVEIIGSKLSEEQKVTLIYKSLSNKQEKFEVNSLREASDKLRQIRDDRDLLSSTFGHAFVMCGSKRIASISYNGRVWEI